jgi:hypothetical protein
MTEWQLSRPPSTAGPSAGMIAIPRLRGRFALAPLGMTQVAAAAPLGMTAIVSSLPLPTQCPDRSTVRPVKFSVATSFPADSDWMYVMSDQI